MNANAERIRQEAIQFRADTEAEAIRHINAARDEAKRIREQAEKEAWTDAKRTVGEAVDEIERVRDSLAQAIGRMEAARGEPRASEDAVDIWDAAGKPPTQS